MPHEKGGKMIFPLINRETLKAAMKKQGLSYNQLAAFMKISSTGLFFKLSGRKGRGIMPFTEEEVQVLRAMFGDSILNPAPHDEPKRKAVNL